MSCIYTINFNFKILMYLFEIESDTESVKEIFHPQVHFSDGCDGQCRVRLIPEATESIYISHMTDQALGLSSALFPGTIVRAWLGSGAPALKRAVSMLYPHHKQWLNLF